MLHAMSCIHHQPTKDSAMMDESQWVAAGDQVNGFASLPQPLLEQILLTGTSKKDKKALRQTCRLFLQTVDNSLTCIKMTDGEAEELEKLLKRVQHVHSLTKVALTICCHMDSLLKQLPGHITTLSIMTRPYGLYSVKYLANLPCLATLAVYTLDSFTGLDCVSGLTRLFYRNRPAGCWAHLAPTLKHLGVYPYVAVEDIKHLTNLEVLECGIVSPTLFEQCGQLPLKHVSIRLPQSCSLLFNHAAWTAAPTTLTRLTLGDFIELYTFEYVSFPSHITHLQLSLADADKLSKCAAALPGLTRLDLIWIVNRHRHRFDAFKDLSKLTKLQFLGMFVVNDDDETGDAPWHRQTVLVLLPEVATAVRRGVELNVVVDLTVLEAMWSQFHDLHSMKTSWATYA